MNKQEILKKLETIFQDLLDNSGFVLNEDICQDNFPEWDSLFHITLVASVEAEFKIVFDTEDIDKIRSVNKLIECITKYIG